MDEPLPLIGAPDAPSEEEYQAFVLALSQSARGRGLLAEHARRSRAADSEMLLDSVQRLEGLVRNYTEAAPPPAESPHDELRGMIEAIRGVQAELDISMLAEQVARLAQLIEGVQQRIETLAAPAAPAQATEQTPMPAFAAPLEGPESAAETEVIFDSEPVAEPLPETAIDFAAVTEVEPAVEPAIEPVAEFVPEPATAEETPVEAAAPGPDIAPDTVTSEAEPAAIPDVEWPAENAADEEAARSFAQELLAQEAVIQETGGQEAVAQEPATEAPRPPAAPPTTGLAIAALVETLAVPATDDDEPEVKVYKAGSIPPPPPFAGEDFGPRGRAVPPPLDPLADIKALTEDERLALFT